MNFKRVMGLMQKDYLVLKDMILYLYIVLVMLSTALSCLGVYPTLNLYMFFLCTGGFIFTRHVFSDLHDDSKGYSYLILPASSFEKLFSRWLLSGIVYALVFTILLYGLFSLSLFTAHLMPTLSSKLLITQPSFWQSLGAILPSVWHTILVYLVLHSVVFLGAIYFKKHALFKTSLTLMVLVSLLALFIGLMTYFLCPGCMVFGLMHLFKRVYLGGYYFFWICLAPICLAIAYVRFKEYEI